MTTYSPYRLYKHLKDEDVTYKDVEEWIQLLKKHLPAYEQLIQKYISAVDCTAVLVKSDAYDQPHYRIIGYDSDQRVVFAQLKPRSYDYSKGPDIKQFDIEEFIFGPYRIWDTVNPMDQYNLQRLEDAMVELPF